MEHANDSQGLVITAAPLLLGFVRASINTHRALDESGAFFRWCSDYPQAPIKDLLDADNHPAGQQWCEIIIAQSLDMFADSGMNAINWRASLVEALGQVAHLSGLGPHHIKLAGFALDFRRGPGPERVGALPHQDPSALLPGFVPLTMATVSRGLSYASAQIPQIVDLLEQLNPHSTRVEHSMLASAILALSAVGPLTGYRSALVGGPADPWHAHMSWDIPEDFPAPAAALVAMLDAQAG